MQARVLREVATMREPKRLAHRQAERNKARAQKRWIIDDGDDETLAPGFTSAEPRRDVVGSDTSRGSKPGNGGSWPA
jgi:hypothetical protein